MTDQTKWNNKSAIAQIEKCGFECEGGPLANNVAWKWLREAADALMEEAASAIQSLKAERDEALEEAARVAERKAEAQSQFQKSAYDRGDDVGGHGHWKAQCELTGAAAAIRALQGGK